MVTVQRVGALATGRAMGEVVTMDTMASLGLSSSHWSRMSSFFVLCVIKEDRHFKNFSWIFRRWIVTFVTSFERDGKSIQTDRRHDE